MVLGVLIAATCAATAQTLPQFGSHAHLGVGTCAGTTCHNAPQPWMTSMVSQNEFQTWSKKDKHAQAYRVLSGELGTRIAAKLGIGRASQAAVCLDCHANNIPVTLRSRGFDIADGVGCEACHGGAERWLGVHVSGAGGHAENVAAGMFPTENPVARARLCLSCHLGSDTKSVTHRMLAAGHPRLRFELGLFTAAQPAHFSADKDYLERKPQADGVQVWAIGQAVALREFLDAMLNPRRNRDGIFPELTFFDCNACHHSMSSLRWEPRIRTGLGPGVPRLNDANLLMLQVIAATVSPDLAEKLATKGRDLHLALLKGTETTAAAALALRTVAEQAVDTYTTHSFGRADLIALLRNLLHDGRSAHYNDYAAAEQATMALSVVILSMQRAGMLNDAQANALDRALDQVYGAVETNDGYQLKHFQAALTAVEQAAP